MDYEAEAARAHRMLEQQWQHHLAGEVLASQRRRPANASPPRSPRQQAEADADLAAYRAEVAAMNKDLASWAPTVARQLSARSVPFSFEYQKTEYRDVRYGFLGLKSRYEPVLVGPRHVGWLLYCRNDGGWSSGSGDRDVYVDRDETVFLSTRGVLEVHNDSKSPKVWSAGPNDAGFYSLPLSSSSSKTSLELVHDAMVDLIERFRLDVR